MIQRVSCWLRLGVLTGGLILSACQGLQPGSAGIEGESYGKVEPRAPARAEFRGAVEGMASDTWTVSGVSFAITSDTQFRGDISLGDLVKVRASVFDDGFLAAQEVDLEETAQDAASPEPGDEVEVVGTVDTIEASSWTIGGTPVLVTESTEIDAGIVLGDTVKVHATLGADGTLTAREIDIEADGEEGEGDADDDLTDDEVKFSGTVEALGAESWTISGVVVLINAATDIDEGIAIGSVVHVEAIADPAGILTATEIESDGDNPDEGDEGESDQDDADDDEDDEDSGGSDDENHEDDDEDDD